MKRIKLFLQALPMAGRIFYSPKLHKFFQVKAMYLKGAECGDFTTYYADAQTNITRQMLSYRFLAECALIDDISTFRFAELEKIGSAYAWKAK